MILRLRAGSHGEALKHVQLSYSKVAQVFPHSLSLAIILHHSKPLSQFVSAPCVDSQPRSTPFVQCDAKSDGQTLTPRFQKVIGAHHPFDA
jgi:hypothetical protein